MRRHRLSRVRSGAWRADLIEGAEASDVAADIVSRGERSIPSTRSGLCSGDGRQRLIAVGARKSFRSRSRGTELAGCDMLGNGQGNLSLCCRLANEEESRADCQTENNTGQSATPKAARAVPGEHLHKAPLLSFAPEKDFL